MKKLIALTAASVMASSAAVAAVSLSGSASVTYAEATNDISAAASLTIAGSNGGTSATIIWPNQKKILGIVEASAEEIAKAKFTAAMASRTNVALSIPMLLSMTGFAHGNLF